MQQAKSGLKTTDPVSKDAYILWTSTLMHYWALEPAQTTTKIGTSSIVLTMWLSLKSLGAKICFVLRASSKE